MATTRDNKDDAESTSDDVPAKKSTTEKTAAKKSAANKKTPARKVSPMKVARSAVQQLVALTGRHAESVIGIQRTEDGWQVDLEVVESRRIPDSTDVLATYQVETDGHGELTGYHRVRRYIRGKGGNGEVPVR